jgi:hypothetical protein
MLPGGRKAEPLTDDPKLVDLPPHEWRSSDEREKPHEPIFAAGWPVAVGVLIGIAGATLAINMGWGPLASGAAALIGGLIGNFITAVIQK